MNAFAQGPTMSNGTNEPGLAAPHGGPQETSVVPELSLIAPPTISEMADDTAPPMAPGIGGFNIDPPAPTASPAEGDLAIEHTRDRLLLMPELVPQPPVQAGRKTKSSFIFHLVAIVAMVGITLLTFPDEAGKEVSDISGAVMPLHESLPSAKTSHEGLASAKTSVQPARLVIQSQNGLANEPLPLGISLKDASGGETVTVAGLAEGTELSLGTSLGLAGWLVSAGDLDKTFVGAPKDFVGAMDATVNLRSAKDQLLDSQIIRLEWSEKEQERLAPRSNPPKSALVQSELVQRDLVQSDLVQPDLPKSDLAQSNLTEPTLVQPNRPTLHLRQSDQLKPDTPIPGP